MSDHSASLQQSLFHLFQREPKRKCKATKIDRTHHGLSLTEEEVLTIIRSAEEKKLAKQNKKQLPKTSTQSQITCADSQSLSLSSQPSQNNIDIKSCFKCKKLIANNISWRTCENSNCNNCVCDVCLPQRFKKNPEKEYFCSRKCAKN